MQFHNDILSRKFDLYAEHIKNMIYLTLSF